VRPRDAVEIGDACRRERQRQERHAHRGGESGRAESLARQQRQTANDRAERRAENDQPQLPRRTHVLRTMLGPARTTTA
jgi:hypothetical protein